MRQNTPRQGDSHVDAALEAMVTEFYGRPFVELLMIARDRDACEREDLLDLGWVLLGGMVDLANGHVSRISMSPSRLPDRGMYREEANRLRKHFADAFDSEDAS